jgi:hypothetical protein
LEIFTIFVFFKSMIEIGDILVSLDILDVEFICDTPACKGQCCVEGDSGAPLTDEETILLEREYYKIIPYMTERGKIAVEKSGKWETDWSGDKVTPLNEGQECAYSYVDKGNIYKCSIEKAWSEGKLGFRKPVSCHLYPIRVSNIGTKTALNYHKWPICKPALTLGNKAGIPMYRFLRDAIVRVYGEDFYEELEKVAGEFQKR